MAKKIEKAGEREEEEEDCGERSGGWREVKFTLE